MGTKEQVLALLESHKGQYLSGEELAGELALSRTAVWKAINSLRAAGYEIQAAQNRGYCLNARTDVLSVQGVENNLEPAAAECALELIPCTASTNSLLRQRAAEGAPEGLVILANQQTRGRGRLGREFYSPPDTGVYMSILLRPRELRPMRAVHITTMAAVAACAAISEQTQKVPQIKWVNDILLGGKKVCGILTEGSFNLETGQLEDVVLGIGFNVYPPAGGFPAELADTADSILFEQTDEGKNRLAASFLNHFSVFTAAAILPTMSALTARKAWSSAKPSASSRRTASAPPMFWTSTGIAGWWFDTKTAALSSSPLRRSASVRMLIRIFEAGFTDRAGNCQYIQPPYMLRDALQKQRASVSKKPRRVCRPQAANRVRSFSAGACTWRKIPYRLQV